MRRKICVVTGTRAEYGLLFHLMRKVLQDPQFELQIVVTGMHLENEFGATYCDIENDGFVINRRIKILTSSDKPVDISKSMAVCQAEFAEVLEQLKPDLVLVLGDRYEIFAAVAAAMVACIPIAHLHGGEATEGLIDEAIRHSITKMSHYHFVAAKEYRRRVIQLGESPDRVFLVGALGVDSISKTDLMTREELEASLGFEFGHRNLLVTFHPVTLDNGSASAQMTELLNALKLVQETKIIFTLPNADVGGRELIQMIEGFVHKNANAVKFASLGQRRYFSTIAQVDGVIGNSSSGLIEVPSFKKATVNIGDRQRGRLKAGSVIDCKPITKDITAAIQYLYDPNFQISLTKVRNPYGEPGASLKILNILKQLDFSNVLKKRFYDIQNSCV